MTVFPDHLEMTVRGAQHRYRLVARSDAPRVSSGDSVAQRARVVVGLCRTCASVSDVGACGATLYPAYAAAY